MRPASSLLTAVTFCLAAACADDPPLAPTGEAIARGDAEAAEAASVTMMTRNIYVGTDVDAVIAALASPDGSDDLPALLAAIETLRRTDFPARAAAVAGEIARTRPHVVGIQEITKLDVTLPPLGVDLHYDFLPTLLGELSARGLEYAVAAQTKNIEADPIPGVSLEDYDVMLVDQDRVTVQSADGAPYQANLGQVAPGVVLQRGWVRVTGMIAGQSWTFASTHLEPGDAPGLSGLRALQAGELAALLAGATRAVVMGDLNDVPGSQMYQVLAGAGFTDVWAALRPGAVGLTCCHPYDLSGRVAHFTQRIDFILARGAEGPSDKAQGSIEILGEVPGDRVPGPDYPIWPSDHAGLAATLLDPRAAVQP